MRPEISRFKQTILKWVASHLWGLHFIVNFLGWGCLWTMWKKDPPKKKNKNQKSEETRKERSWKIWISRKTMYRVKASRFEHANPALVLNPPGASCIESELGTCLVTSHLLNRFKDPSICLKTFSPKELVQNQWHPSKTMASHKEPDSTCSRPPR